MHENYRIHPPQLVEGFPAADGVFVNQYGAWLGTAQYLTVNEHQQKLLVVPYQRDRQYIPAPDGWRQLVVEDGRTTKEQEH